MNYLHGEILKEVKKNGSWVDYKELIKQGADFIRKDVLANASLETLDLFEEVDPSSSICMFILTKAVYIYTVGAKKKNEVPDFFKPATKDRILAFRKEPNNGETLNELQRLVTDPTQFETEPQECAKLAFRRLRNIAAGELQKSLLVTRCWEEASKLLTQ